MTTPRFKPTTNSVFVSLSAEVEGKINLGNVGIGLQLFGGHIWWANPYYSLILADFFALRWFLGHVGI